MAVNKVVYDGNTLVDLTSDTVTAEKMLSGVTAHDKSGAKITGSIVSKTAQTYTPRTSDQTILSGQYLTGNQTIKGDANLVAGNIKRGVSIFGVAGTLEAGSGGGSSGGSMETCTVCVSYFSGLGKWKPEGVFITLSSDGTLQPKWLSDGEVVTTGTSIPNIKNKKATVHDVVVGTAVMFLDLNETFNDVQIKINGDAEITGKDYIPSYLAFSVVFHGDAVINIE